MKKKLVLSFSMGRTSAFMTKWCLENLKDEYKMIVVCANVGKEREESLVFADRCDKEFGFNTVYVEAVTNPVHGKGVSARVVDFNTMARNGEPFEDMIKKHGLPNVNYPICTRELKTNAIRAYLRSIGWKKYYTAIGIRVDEIDRVNPKHKELRYLYPLVNMIPSTLNDINYFWTKQPFDLEIKSYEGNCDLCFKKSLRKQLTILSENPQLADWWNKMEHRYENYLPETQRQSGKVKLPKRIFRNNLKVDDLVKLSKEPFEKAVTNAVWRQEYTQLLLFDINLDTSNGCSESCEAF